MLNASRLIPLVASGIVFGLASMLLLDAVIISRREKSQSHQVTSLLLIPVVLSIVGFMSMMMISPNEVRNHVPRAKAVLFFSWIVYISSTVGALVICNYCFSGLQQRERAVPGVSVVLFSSLVPLSGAVHWWGRQSFDDW